jgi:hypothetical protein
MLSYASATAAQEDPAPGGPSTGPGEVGYTSTFQEDFCNYGRTQEPSTGPGAVGYTSMFQEDFCNYGRTQESSTGPRAVDYTFQEDVCNYGRTQESKRDDLKNRSKNQHHEVVYKGRNLYGIEELKRGSSKNRSKNRHQEDPVVYKGKNRHQEDTVVYNGKIRPAECPPGQAERAIWSVLEYDWVRDA